ncbi:Diaminopimelate epimerase [Austwickia chelonae]|uniref:Diaminopimelate epimerase n=1 Tax=Austwickia chelonae NBRC 105200 TaxID=1184607 RepID=K6UNV7_9MICO|nr:hypothetical protein [Austwickia chelonae]GAB79291.1 hypothetical protein AUCHE_22_00610 [Austwickia chelonae NBRC 105200]SEW37969.1 Diaminopimelate epimerase [Austwickia chelonae]
MTRQDNCTRKPPPRQTPRITHEVDFVKLSPTSNMTVLVTSQHHPADYPSIANQLLSECHVHAEQVGFVRPPTTPQAHTRLHMAGNEFCGNACMALAALTAAENGLDNGHRTEIVLETSGSTTSVPCDVERLGADYTCRLTVPDPIGVENYTFPGRTHLRSALVRYPDAVHLVVECSQPDQTMRKHAEDAAAQLAADENAAVIAVLLYDPDRAELTPLVSVPALGSLIWEGSCGSGTASVGAYLSAQHHRSIHLGLRLPGGPMQVHVDHRTHGTHHLQIDGHVRIVAEGKAYIHG